jgi:hypothetical protein
VIVELDCGSQPPKISKVSATHTFQLLTRYLFMFFIWPARSHRDALTFRGFAADQPTLPVSAFAGMLLTRVFGRQRRVRRAGPTGLPDLELDVHRSVATSL